MRISKPHAEQTEVPPRLVAMPDSLAVPAEWIIRRELLWLALLSPFLLFPERRWAWLIVALPLLWVIRFVARKRFVPATPLDWPIALLMLMVAISIFATFNIDVSLPKIAGLLLGISLYYALVEWIAGSPERPLRFGSSFLGGRFSGLSLAVAIFLAAGVVLALVGLVGTNWLDKMEGLSDVTRGLPKIVSGLPGAENGFQPNEVAGSLLLVALPAFAVALWSWISRTKSYAPDAVSATIPTTLLSVAFTLSLTVILATLILTQSRGALVGATFGAALVLFILVPRLRIWLLIGLLAALLIFILNDPVSLVNRLLQPALPGILTSDPANVRVRLDIWSSAIATIRNAPLTGVGMNTFRYIMPARYPSPLIPPAYDVAHAHNLFLQVALDLGLPGLAAYLAIYVIAIALLVKTLRSAATNYQRAVAAGIGAGLLAFLIFGITDTVALGAKPGIFFWALLGLDVALWMECTRTTIPRPKTHGSPS